MVKFACKPGYQFSWNYFKFKLYFPPVLHPGLSGYRNNGHITHFEKKTVAFNWGLILHTFKKYSHVHIKLPGESPGLIAKILILSKNLSQNPQKISFLALDQTI